MQTVTNEVATDDELPFIDLTGGSVEGEKRNTEVGD